MPDVERRGTGWVGFAAMGLTLTGLAGLGLAIYSVTVGDRLSAGVLLFAAAAAFGALFHALVR